MSRTVRLTKRTVTRAPIPFVDWLWELPFLLAGAAILWLCLVVLAAGLRSQQPNRNYVVVTAILGICGLACLGSVPVTLPKRTTVVVDPEARTLVSKVGRPLLRKTATTIRLDDLRRLILSREDVHTTTGRSLLHTTKHFRRYWSVAVDGWGLGSEAGSLFTSVREGQTRRVVEVPVGSAEEGQWLVARLTAEMLAR